VKRAYDLIRSQVPFAKEDRVFAKDVAKIKEMIASNLILENMGVELEF